MIYIIEIMQLMSHKVRDNWLVAKTVNSNSALQYNLFRGSFEGRDS